MTKLEETDKEIKRLLSANRGTGIKPEIFNSYMLMDIARSLAKIADNTSKTTKEERE